MKNTANATGSKPIAVLLQSISGVSAINPLVVFMTSMEERERCYSSVLSRTPHETDNKDTHSSPIRVNLLCLNFVCV
jgi:hypothetical protein